MSWLPPTLVLIWLVGVICATWALRELLDEDPMLRLSCELQPWRVALLALSAVAWPGTLFVSLIVSSRERRR